MQSRRRFLTVVGCSTGTAVAGCLGTDRPRIRSFDPAPGTWPSFGYDLENTRYNPHANPPESDVEERWSQDVAGVLRGTLVADDLVLSFGDGGLWAFEVGDGTERWHSSDPVRSAAIHDGTIYVCSHHSSNRTTGGIRGYDVRTGTKRFHTTIEDESIYSDLRVTEGFLFVRGANGLSLLDRQSRRTETQWTETDVVEPAITDGSIVAIPDDSNVGRLSFRGILGDRLSMDWTFGLPGPALEPTVHEDRVLVGYAPILRELTSITSIDVHSGDERWELQSIGIGVYTPAVAQDTGFTQFWTGETTQRVARLDLADGHVDWSFEMDERSSFSTATDSLVLLHTDAGSDTGEGRVVALDHDGDLRWQRRAPAAPTRVGPIAVGDAVIVTGTGGGITVFS